MKIYLAHNRGFCAGVRRAIELTENLRKEHPDRTLFLLHELVHNEQVTESLLAQGIRIISTPAEAAPGGMLIFSAHGVSAAVEAEARAREKEITVYDATCPLVKKVQDQASAQSREGKTILIAGKRGHREVEGILGRIPGPAVLLETSNDADSFQPEADTKYAILSQTTFLKAELDLILEILRRKIPDITVPGSVCSATELRQDTVRRIAEICDVVLVVGSAKSSNTLRLCEEVRAAGKRAVLVSDHLNEEARTALQNVQTVGVTSGASAPESSVQTLLSELKLLTGGSEVVEIQ